LPEGADLDLCRPDPARRKKMFRVKDVVVTPEERLVTYVARDLEPYRGFHVLMRALPRILAERKDARVVVVGGDGVSYGAKLAHGNWRETMLREVGDRIDLSRVHFVGKIPYEDFLAMLQRSDAHIYLTYPFVASWSLREAMASGAPIVGSDTAPVTEFVEDRVTGLLVPFLDPGRIADAVLALLNDRRLARRLGRAARGMAENTLDLQTCLDRYEEMIAQVAGA
jgi:glycosyltransferase involved in cell wall biosynthesis